MIIALLCLTLFGVIYAAVVRRLRRRPRAAAYTPWLVVVGDGVVVAAFASLYGLEAGVALFLMFAAAGAPMVIEYVDDHTGTPDKNHDL